jgi:hypothetical protein
VGFVFYICTAAPVAAISTAAICAASWAAPDFATRRGIGVERDARPSRPVVT